MLDLTRLERVLDDVLCVKEDLWRDVVWRADKRAGVLVCDRATVWKEWSGRVEICEKEVPCGREEEIVRLDVTAAVAVSANARIVERKSDRPVGPSLRMEPVDGLDEFCGPPQHDTLVHRALALVWGVLLEEGPEVAALGVTEEDVEVRRTEKGRDQGRDRGRVEGEGQAQDREFGLWTRLLCQTRGSGSQPAKSERQPRINSPGACGRPSDARRT